MFWAKQQLGIDFIQNLRLNFLSFLDLYLMNESGSSGDNNRDANF